ncbi:MAG TPA: hypothetical protein VM265_09385 [Sphingomicrobium sp.]|nr:hypothetical protein [Sphingomicrobium sp.]
MSASLRFLALAVVGWAGLRAVSLGMVPGSDGFTLGRAAAPAPAAAAGIPAIAATEFPPLEPPQPSAAGDAAGPQHLLAPGGMAAMPPQAVPIYYYPAAMPGGARLQPAAFSPPPQPRPLTNLLPEPAPLFYSPIPQLDDWPLSRLASAGMPMRRSAAAAPQQSLPAEAVQARLDRLQLSSWALLRGRQGLVGGTDALATGGTLGGSQAGARLTYNFDRRLALSIRSSSPVGGRGGEVAAGLRVTPLPSLPVSITAERRQAIGKLGGGRSAFALFAEGGLYQRPVGWGFNLDAYAQAGMVGVRSRDLFADGGFTLSRPLFRQLSGGFGLWGGVQPGLYRVDAGPRLTYQVRHNVRVHLDWRQRLAGKAEPGSGPAVTLAADF